MGVTMPGDQAAVSHPAQCETHTLRPPAMMPYGFQSHSEINRPKPDGLTNSRSCSHSGCFRPLMFCLAIAFPVCGVQQAASVFRNYLYRECLAVVAGDWSLTAGTISFSWHLIYPSVHAVWLLLG